MRRKRLSDFIGTHITPVARAELERIADEKMLSLSELTREYVVSGLKADGGAC
jgi:hypothetical protein